MAQSGIADVAGARLAWWAAVGEQDVADFAHVAERLKSELPHAVLHRLAGAGHLLALDDPGAVARLMTAHLAAVTSGAWPAP